MAIVYRAVKGRELTNAEVDANFSQLANGSIEGFKQSGTDVERSWISKARDFVSVKDFGAVGDGSTDDASAIQAAIDSLAGRGGCVYFPAATYNAGTQIDVDADGITLVGDGCIGHVAVAGATRLVATHSSGSVIRIWNSGCGIKGMTITSNSTRYTGSAGSNYGVRVEAADTASGVTKRVWLERVRITNQPNHGLVMVNDIVCATLLNVDADNVDGHGIFIAGGNFSSRSNKTRPGQVSVINCRTTRTGGHGLAVGEEGTTVSGDIPYRVIVDNLETFYNCVDAAIPFEDYAVYLFGENHVIRGSGIAGYQESDGADAHGGVYLEGNSIDLLNNRYIDTNPYIVKVGKRASLTTDDITIRGGVIVNTQQGAGFYDPAISIDASARNVFAEINTHAAIVASLASEVSGSEVNFKTSKFWYGNRRASAFNTASSEISLADDAAGYISFSAVTRGILSLSGNTAAAKGGVIHFRVGDANAHATVMANSGGDVTGTTGALSGTTGSDGHLTISAHTTENRLYIENRTGALRSFSYMIQATGGGIHSGFTNL